MHEVSPKEVGEVQLSLIFTAFCTHTPSNMANHSVWLFEASPEEVGKVLAKEAPCMPHCAGSGSGVIGSTIWYRTRATRAVCFGYQVPGD